MTVDSKTLTAVLAFIIATPGLVILTDLAVFGFIGVSFLPATQSTTMEGARVMAATVSLGIAGITMIIRGDQ